MDNFIIPEKEKSKRVAIYLRVSTIKQKDSGHGLDVQEEVLRKRCDQLNYTLEENHVYVDGGYSGNLSIEKRPALSRLYKDAEEKQFDIVMVYRLDRFFRSLSRIISAVEKLSVHKVAFRSATEQFETETMNGELMFHLIASFAHHERKLIAMRMMSGKLRSAKEGKWTTGVPPFGYRVNEKTQKLVVQKSEAEVVKKFYEWLVHEKCSLREITRRAIEMKLPTPEHKTIRNKGRWYRRTINRILVNEVYTGEFYYNKYKRPFKYLDAVLDEEHQRPESEHILIRVPAIVSKEMFAKAIDQLKENRRFQKRNEKRTYLFSGLLYSGYSGKKLQSGYQKPKKDLKTPTLGKYYHVYVPTLDRIGDESDQNVTEGQCAETRLIPIWETLVGILSDPKNVIPKLEEYTFKNSNEERTRKKIIELEKQIETTKEQRVRIARAYADMGISEEEYELLMKEKTGREKELVIEKQKLAQTLLKKKEQANRNVVIAQLYEKLKAKLGNVDYEGKQYILRLFVERIVLYQKQGYAEVVFKFPTYSAVPDTVPASVSLENQMRLVLHVKILSEKQRRQEILKSNPAMYRGVLTADLNA
jgi:site-specific DNA recombinase